MTYKSMLKLNLAKKWAEVFGRHYSMWYGKLHNIERTSNTKAS